MMNKHASLICLLSSLYSGVLYSNHLSVIEPDEVKSGYIYEHKYSEKTVFLSMQELESVINAINMSEDIGLCKYAVKLWLVLEMRNSTKRQFRISGNSIKEDGDFCYGLPSEYGVYLSTKLKDD